MRDLETEGHVTDYVTFVISACICPISMIFCCFVRFLGHENHYKYRRLRDLYAWPINWRSLTRDLGTKGHVMVYVTYVISACICVLPWWILFCFVRFFGQGIHSNYCHLRDRPVWPWNARTRHGLRDLTTWQNKKSRRPWRDLQFSKSHVKITQLAIVRMNSLIWKLDEPKKKSSR